MLRSESDIVSAVNGSRDLIGLAVTFLKLWRKHANGVNNVTIPNEDFNLVLMPLKKEGMLSVGLFYTRTDHWSTPTYYDVDDDMYVESYSSSANISGSESHSKDVRCDKFIDLPFKMLMSPKMEVDIIQLAEADKIKKSQAAKVEKIAALERQLSKLKSEPK